MNGWYVVYLLCIAINSLSLALSGHGIKSPLNWISLTCIILAYIAGTNWR